MLTVFGCLMLSELLQTLYFWSVVASFFNPNYKLAQFETFLIFVFDLIAVDGILFLHYTNYKAVEVSWTFPQDNRGS